MQSYSCVFIAPLLAYSIGCVNNLHQFVRQFSTHAELRTLTCSTLPRKHVENDSWIPLWWDSLMKVRRYTLFYFWMALDIRFVFFSRVFTLFLRFFTVDRLWQLWGVCQTRNSSTCRQCANNKPVRISTCSGEILLLFTKDYTLWLFIVF